MSLNENSPADLRRSAISSSHTERRYTVLTDSALTTIVTTLRNSRHLVDVCEDTLDSGLSLITCSPHSGWGSCRNRHLKNKQV